MRWALPVAALLLLGALALLSVGASTDPLSRSCSTELSDAACEGAVSAVMRRGLPDLHPLILAAHVEPGPAPGPQEVGHRATVSFDLLGLPDPVVIELHYDLGAHWGGVLDRSATEIVAWALMPLLLAIILGIGLLVLAWRRVRGAATG